MDQVEHAFRTAVVGGFNRQDVLNYIASSARESREKIAALQKELQDLQAAESALRREKGELEQRVSALQKEGEKLQSENAEREARFAQAQAELSGERSRREALDRELEVCRTRCAQWENDAQAYDDLKTLTATIELEARQRAKAIEDAAEEKARRLRTEAEEILYKVQAGYGRLRGDVDATIAHASGELGRVDMALEQVRSEFAEHDVALKRLLESCRESQDCRAPESLPLDDK